MTEMEQKILSAMVEQNLRWMRSQSTFTLKQLVAARPGPGDYWKPYAQAELEKREGKVDRT